MAGNILLFFSRDLLRGRKENLCFMTKAEEDKQQQQDFKK